MAWKAKIISISKEVSPRPVAGGVYVQYHVTVNFFIVETPAVNFTKQKTVPNSVTPAQVLSAIQNELADLNSGEILPTAIEAHVNEEIDATTTW
jgi:hypothetical protein